MRNPKSTRAVHKAFGFRLEDEDCEELQAQAAELQITVSDLIRRYVLAGLREGMAKNRSSKVRSV